MYAPGQLHQEIAYIAYYYHWPLNDIVDLEHGLRRQCVTEIARINQTILESR